MNATDSVGNQGQPSSTPTFTVDTSYSGDTTASFEYDSGYTYLMDDDNDDLSFDVELGDSADENSDIRLKCYAGSIDDDNLLTETDLQNVGSDGNTFSCEIPADDYSDQSVNVVVQACDAAGNCQQVGETTYNMDLSAPVVANLESEAGVSTFNSEFDMSFEASDAATSVEQVEYFFDDNSPNYGDGNQIDNFDDGSFTVDVSGLSSGEHTLYLRAQDSAGRWSDPQSFTFEYYPSQDPEVSLSVPNSLEVTAGETGKFDVTVENTGEFLIESVNLNVSSDVFSAEESLANMEPGDSISFTFETSPSESDIGEYDVQVSTDNPSASKSFTYRVKANQEQRSSIQSNLDKQVQRLEALRANVTSLQKKVSQRRSDQLAANLSEFESKVKTAQTAIENGKYYKAQSALEGINSDFTSAQNSYQNIKQSYEKSQRFKMILAVLGLIILGVLGGVGYLVHEGRIDSEEVMQEIQQKLDDLDLGSEGESSGPGLLKKIKLKFEGHESEAEEFEWDGFREE